MGKRKNKRGHLNQHDIELFLEGKINKSELINLKDKFKKDLGQKIDELIKSKREEKSFVFESEKDDFIKKSQEYDQILFALCQMFKGDEELKELQEKIHFF